MGRDEKYLKKQMEFLDMKKKSEMRNLLNGVNSSLIIAEIVNIMIQL